MSHIQNISSKEALNKLITGNNEYLELKNGTGDISKTKREYTSKNGQNPYALVITCSDSRVIPEAIFNTGIGELFVIRLAGNILDQYGLASVQYAVEHLGINLIVSLGHTQCGAVGAALSGTHTGYIKPLVDEIKKNIGDEQDPTKASIKNAKMCTKSIEESDIKNIFNKVEIVTGLYDTYTGKVSFLN